MTFPELTPREAYEIAIAEAAAAAGGPALVDYATVRAVDTLANLNYWKPASAAGYPVITYSFPVVTGAADEPADYAGTGRSGTLRSFSEAQAEAARLAVAIWDDLIPLTFVEAAGDPNADMRFFNSTLINTAGGAPAGLGTDGDIWIYNYDANPPETRDWTAGEFYFGYWFLHEVGHTLGLSHAGGYPGPGYNGLNYLQDSAVFTLMSYNSNGAAEVAWRASMATPMVNDMAAIHYIYGADMTTRTGDTVYGFNSNVLDRLPYNFDVMLAQEGKIAPLTIWDAGGIDTIDLSKFGSDAQIDLTEGGYSNAGGQDMAIGIASGAVIENAIAGRGNDVMFGNGAGNTLQGNDGNDRIYGGAETEGTVRGPRDFIGIDMNAGGSARNQYLAASGMTGFSGAQFTFEQLVKISGVPTGSLTFASYNVSGNDNQFLIEGNGTIRIIIANKAAYDTGISIGALLDEHPHRLSLTWDKASGTLQVFIDGSLAHSGTYTAAIGASVGANGWLVLGQEQDSLGGGFDTTQVFQGVMGDVRIFNDVRTAGEISTTAFAALSTSEQGLVHNWQVKASDTTTVTDIAAAPITLNVVNGARVTDTAPAAHSSSDDDTLIGGKGADQLFGGAGNDVLTGDGDGLSADAPIYGLALNTGSATGQELRLSNISVLPVTGLTAEFEIKFEGAPATQWFFSFGDLSMLIDAGNMGLWINVKGSWTYSEITLADLGDGNAHRVSFTWDSATGTFAHYLDGEQVKTGTNFKTSSTLANPGTLSVDPVNGTIGDIRIYDRALTRGEVFETADAALADPANTPGLVLNWQAGANGTVTDARGGTAPSIIKGTGAAPIADVLVAPASFDDTLSGGLGNDILTGGAGDDTLSGAGGTDTAVYSGARGNYLLVLNADGDVLVADQRAEAPDATDLLSSIEQLQFSDVTMTMEDALNKAPSAVSLVPVKTALAENSSTAVRTKIAAIAVTDDVFGTNTLRLTGADAASFEIVGTDLFLRAGVALDFEIKNSLQFGVTVNDAAFGSGPAASSPLMSLAIMDINELPTGAPTAMLADGAEDKSYTLSAAQLLQGLADPDGDALSVVNLTASSRTVTNSGNGNFTISAPANANGVVTLTYDVTDGHGGTLKGQTRTYTVTAANDAPGEVALSVSSVPEFRSNGTVIGTLAAADADAGDTFTYQLLDTAGGRFTIVDDQLRVANGLLLDFEQASSHVISVKVTDESGAAFTKSFEIAVSDVNPESVKGDGKAHKFVGGSGNDTLAGGAGADTLEGRGGNDRYTYDPRDSIVEVAYSAGGGIDTLYSSVTATLPKNVEILRLLGTAAIDGTGTAAPESIIGNLNANRLTGGAGKDVLNGKAGADMLFGGMGADSLVGDAGNDVFKYTSVSESRKGAGERDFIAGFTRGDDKINLAAIDANVHILDNQAFRFVGTAEFGTTGNASAGQLRVSYAGGSYIIIDADVHGDGITDMQILVGGIGAIGASDFVL